VPRVTGIVVRATNTTQQSAKAFDGNIQVRRQINANTSAKHCKSALALRCTNMYQYVPICKRATYDLVIGWNRLNQLFITFHFKAINALHKCFYPYPPYNWSLLLIIVVFIFLLFNATVRRSVNFNKC